MKSILCNIVSRHPSGVAIILAVAVAMAAGGCSTRKNTAASRNYQAFITRYNVYFNGDQHYKETLKEMESVYEDDYSGPYILHPAEAYNVPAAPQPTGSFTRSIEKAQKAIQLHSIKKRPRRTPGRRNDPEYRKWLKREEYNPFLHNAWMMMGRSQYMNGDFLGAAATFYYVSRHFSWLDATVTEARLWEARCYCALDWLYEAEVIISRISDSKLESKLLRELHSFVSADFYVRSHMYDRAIPHLSEAARMASKPQKTRLYFILGRVCAEAGRKKEAYQAYRKAGSGVGASYRARFNARIKQSEVYDGAAIASEVNALRRLTRYGSNRDYLDQIYYAIANLYLSRGDTVNAITNYELAAERSTRNGIDKAISQATLGGLYYDLGQYDKAQFCYSEAVPQLPDTYPGYAGMKRRSDLLDELAVYTQNVTLNDSLLRLA
ncbi:lipopolysaccharide assembly protein LapB, partial [uncultured Duncaniella sp.]